MSTQALNNSLIAIDKGLSTTQVTFVSDFIGMHANAWPVNGASYYNNGNVSSSPLSIPFKMFRTHDSQWGTVYNHNPSIGVYNFTNATTIYNYIYSNGLSLLVTIYGTPLYNATAVNVGSFIGTFSNSWQVAIRYKIATLGTTNWSALGWTTANSATSISTPAVGDVFIPTSAGTYVVGCGTAYAFDGYSGAGGESAPVNMLYWVNYCVALATQFPNVIHYEIWNEPVFNEGMTPQQLAVMVRLANQAIKSVNPNAKIHSPPQPDILYNTTTTPAATDEVNLLITSAQGYSYLGNDGTGTRMIDWVDIIDIHVYAVDISTVYANMLGFKYWLNYNGISNSIPMWFTEFGDFYYNSYGLGTPTCNVGDSVITGMTLGINDIQDEYIYDIYSNVVGYIQSNNNTTITLSAPALIALTGTAYIHTRAERIGYVSRYILNCYASGAAKVFYYTYDHLSMGFNFDYYQLGNASATNCTFINNQMTVSGVTGVFKPGQLLSGGSLPNNSIYITYQVSGTTGGAGIYAVNISQGVISVPFNIAASSNPISAATASSCTCSGTTLAISGTITGSFQVGQYINGSGIGFNQYYIVNQLSGTTGLAGQYQINNSLSITVPIGIVSSLTTTLICINSNLNYAIGRTLAFVKEIPYAFHNKNKQITQYWFTDGTILQI